MIGHTLGGRYELLARVGGGGMALVYKARDILLNRFVAVKVLRQQFMHDEEFVRRFRREAQAAASLSHPNIVSIYDVGQEDDVHYIVMEYVDGNNLNEIIRERAPLQAEEAVRIASQICDALDHAHHNQIIHRDIKPHNILIGTNGRVKVTDFGIARAVTSSTITQTGSVVGSVHYFSPEHAKGVTTGEKSDIYSLGIVLYQMLTGRLPFLGESPISVALKHLQEPFEEPRLVNPHIPQSVENVILRAMRKNPQERYATAKTMLADLETCLQPQRLHEPRTRFPSDEDDDGDGEEKTRVIPALKPDMHMSGQETLAKGDDAKRLSREEEEEPRRRWIFPTVFSVLAIVLIGILIWAVMALKGQLSPKDVEIPTVVGKDFQQAKADLEKVGLHVLEPAPQEPSDTVPENYVVKQDKQDMSVKEGATIVLTVSSGKELTPMPKLTGSSYDDAVDRLKSLGVDEDRIVKDEVNSDEDPGDVLEQKPAADEGFDPKEDSVTLTVSKGPETIDMPKLIDMTLDEAKAEIEKSGLKLDDKDISYEPSYTEKDKVFKQFPATPNEPVAVGTNVKLWVSSGYPEDAKEKTIDVTVFPAAEGTVSTIRIVLSDARGDSIEWGTKKIKTATTIPITLVLSPDKRGEITLYRDDEFYNDIPVPYDDIPVQVDPDGTDATESPSGDGTNPQNGGGNPAAGNDGTDGTGSGDGTNGTNGDNTENAQ